MNLVISKDYSTHCAVINSEITAPVAPKVALQSRR